MSSNSKETVIGAVAVVIGSIIGKGIVQYATDKEFKKWVNKNLYPTLKKITVAVAPEGIKAAKENISIKFKDRPVVKVVILQLVDLLVDGVVKYNEQFEKELYEIRNDLPEVYEELIAIEEK